jgi:hypothetical protein
MKAIEYVRVLNVADKGQPVMEYLKILENGDQVPISGPAFNKAKSLGATWYQIISFPSSWRMVGGHNDSHELMVKVVPEKYHEPEVKQVPPKRAHVAVVKQAHRYIPRGPVFDD